MLFFSTRGVPKIRLWAQNDKLRGPRINLRLRGAFIRWVHMGFSRRLLGAFGKASPESNSNVIESVRSAMLRVLDEYSGASHVQLDLRISDARDLETLWYLRPELMNAISASRGEAVARNCVETVTACFKGYCPGGAVRRAAPAST